MFAVVFLSLLLSACNNHGGGILDRLLSNRDNSTVPVTVSSVRAHDKTYDIRASATIQPSNSANIVTNDKIIVKSIPVSIGSHVYAGDTILKAVKKSDNSKLKDLQLSLKTANADVDKNLYLIRNRDRLLDAGKIDQNMYDSLYDDLDASEAKIEKIQAEISKLKEASTSVELKSPINGIVSSLDVKVGNNIAEGKVVAKIINIDPMSVVFELPSYETSAIATQMPMTIELSDLGTSFQGVIERFDTSIDPENQTFKVYANVPNKKGYLKTGMNAEVRFVSKIKHRFYLVPAEALIKKNRRYYVFTVINGIAHKIEVFPKGKKGNFIEIAKGLRQGDLVVAKGHEKLSEGSIVEIWGR